MCCCRCSGTDSSCDCSVEVESSWVCCVEVESSWVCCVDVESSWVCCVDVESSWVCCFEPVLLSCCCSAMGASSGCCSETVSACGRLDVDSSLEVDGCGSAVLTSEVSFLFDAFFPGLYFLPLIARWSFFSATAKSLATRNCVTLELKSFFLIKKCAAAAKHLVGSLVSSLVNCGWNGHGSIKLQQFSSLSSSGVSLSFSNLSSVGADKCGGIFN